MKSTAILIFVLFVGLFQNGASAAVTYLVQGFGRESGLVCQTKNRKECLVEACAKAMLAAEPDLQEQCGNFEGVLGADQTVLIENSFVLEPPNPGRSEFTAFCELAVHKSCSIDVKQ